VCGPLTLNALIRRSLRLHSLLPIILTWVLSSRIGAITFFWHGELVALVLEFWGEDDLDDRGGCDADVFLLRGSESCEDMCLD
jgi:hypothetical protein